TVQPIPAPSISSLDPTATTIGSAVTITGANFGGSGTVTFNGTTAGISQWTSTSITATVPSGATSGAVVVTAGGQARPASRFRVAPEIATVTPGSGPVGQSVTIQGTGFGGSQGGSSTVRFNGTTATSISSWTSTSITALVPVGATTGNVVVTVGGYACNGKPFTVTTPPAIAAVTPRAGVSGQIVVITGVNFGATQGGLTFNGAGTDILSWSTTRVEARVPLGLPLSVVSLVLTANGE